MITICSFFPQEACDAAAATVHAQQEMETMQKLATQYRQEIQAQRDQLAARRQQLEEVRTRLVLVIYDGQSSDIFFVVYVVSLIG